MFPVTGGSSAANLGSFTLNTGVSSRGNYIGTSISPAVQHTMNSMNTHSNSESNLIDVEGFHHYNVPLQYAAQAGNAAVNTPNDLYRQHPHQHQHQPQEQQQQQQPMNLASMLDKLSLGPADSRIPRSGGNGMRQSIFNNYPNESATIKLEGLPGDLSKRECCLIFALARGVVELEAHREPANDDSARGDSTIEKGKDKDIKNEYGIVKVKDGETLTTTITAKINNPRMARCYLKILKSKPRLLGPNTVNDYKIEIIEEDSKKNVTPLGANQVTSDSSFHMKHSSPSIPSMILPQISTSNLPPLYSSQIQNPASISQTQQPMSSYTTTMGPNFAFSNDSFMSGFSLREQEQQRGQGRPQVQSQQTQQQHHSFVSTHPLSNTSFGDSLQTASSTMNSFSRTAGDVGKSFLLMEGDDINENIWNPNSPMFYSSQQDSMGLPFQQFQTQTQTQTQTLDNEYQVPLRRDILRTPFNIGGGNSVAAASKPQNTSIFPSPTSVQDPNNSYLGGLTTPTSAIPSSYQISFSAPSSQYSARATPSTPNVMLPKQIRPQNNYRQTTVVSNGNSNNSNANISVAGANSIVASQNTNISPYSTMSQADLTLLSKIPPPANPADQNPPCNTLYVANLPPDATEMELRQLFSGQPGFKRLSFRNKTNPPGHGHGHGHSHGPMCFVEFEDISFATRALAELYGTQLPRATASNKGGIRLSFSKNPLGVRGPNSRRSNSNTNVGTNTVINTAGSTMLASSSPLRTSPNRIVGNSNHSQHNFNYVASFGKR